MTYLKVGKVTITASAAKADDKTIDIDIKAARAVVAAAAKAMATGGDVIPFANMFTLQGGVVLDDLEFAVNAGTTALTGAMSQTGDLTLPENTSGTVTVTATLHQGATAIPGLPVTFTITAVTPKTKLTKVTPAKTLKVGAADLAGSDLFTVQPTSKAFTIAIDASDTTGSANIASSGKLHAVKPGTATVKATVTGETSVTATTTVTIAAPDLTGVILKDSSGNELDWVDDTDHTQGYAFDGGDATTPTAETELTIVPVPQYAVLPADATIAIASDEVTVATVPTKPTGGKFKVKPLAKEGDAVITVTVKTGMVIKLTVHVDAAP
ncbi:hypothetical protein ABNO07_003581 [Salmonella enterica subsp. enterica serovar Bareilly]